MNNTPEFEIENGVLVKYRGDGGEVTVPKGVTSIGDHAFRGCLSLTSIVIPDSVMHIGDGVFIGCESLTKIICSDKITAELDEDIEDKTLGYFLDRLKADAVTEEEREEWFAFISANTLYCLAAMKNNVWFYSFVMEKGWILSGDIDEVLVFTDSVECRVMILEYKINN